MRFSCLVFVLTSLMACQQENNLLTEGEMLFLRHEGASMPLLVRGNAASNVILLMVHGGAGGSSASHIEDFMGRLEPDYMVAYWDQRHAGSSQGAFAKEELTLDRMAEDMQMAIRLLKHKYGADKRVFAVGHSWGVILGTYYLISQPNELTGAIFSNGSHSSIAETSARLDYVKGFAQEMLDTGLTMPEAITVEGNTYESLAAVIAWCEANDPIETYPQLRTLYALVDAVYGYVQRTYLQPFSDVEMGISSRELAYQSPYNPLTAQFNSLRTGQLINNVARDNSIQEFYDFSPSMGDITLPVSLIFGRYDDIIGPEVAEAYYAVIGTPEANKELIWLEKSGHSGLYRENIKFSESVRSFVEKHR